MDDVSSLQDLDPWMRIRDPQGNVVGNDLPNELVDREDWRATETGTYTVIVSDNDFDVGNYRLHFARIPGTFAVKPGDEGGPLANGGSVDGFIETGDFDVREFGAEAGAEITIELEDTLLDEDFAPQLRVYAPDGEKIYDQDHVALLTFSHTAVVAGRYVVVASENNTESGQYELRYSSTGDVPIAPTPVPIPRSAWLLLVVLLIATATRRLKRDAAEQGKGLLIGLA